ncbi:transcriptional regulator [Inquilinus sp. CAU 1745]|uniref:helix-turn-helix domain-containing protein n=1 Tax=Inquilinus sp. CAU 1745 TaxID=3140369 RepID=UPI00325AF2B4
MSKISESILRGAREALEIAEGKANPAAYNVHLPEQIDVKAIRKSLKLTQPAFSARFAISLHTLRKWEQEGRQPEGPARAYLKVIAKNPKAVAEALATTD